MEYTIYKITDTEGYFYIGSTTASDLRVRRWNHIAESNRKETPMLKHFKEVGWENTVIEEVEKGYGTKEERLEREAFYIKSNLSDTHCLNKRVCYIAPENLQEEKRKRCLAYHYRNKEKRNKYAREYFHRKKALD